MFFMKVLVFPIFEISFIWACQKAFSCIVVTIKINPRMKKKKGFILETEEVLQLSDVLRILHEIFNLCVRDSAELVSLWTQEP